MTPELIAAIIACLMAVAGLATAATAWIKAKTDVEKVKAQTEAIRRDREVTKQTREADSAKMHDDILKLQFEVTNLKDIAQLHAEHIEDLNKQSSTLNMTLAQVLTKLDSIIEQVKELKDK